MVTGEVLRDILLVSPWEGALASPVANPRQAALQASAPTVNRIHLSKDAGILTLLLLVVAAQRAQKKPAGYFNLAAVQLGPLRPGGDGRRASNVGATSDGLARRQS